MPRAQHTATLLRDGRILVAGGFNALGDIGDVSIYDPAKDRWTSVGTLDHPRGRHTATLLDDGSVLIVGGIDESGVVELAGVPRTEVDLFFPGGVPDDLRRAVAVAR
jgi:hypothetical protein